MIKINWEVAKRKGLAKFTLDLVMLLIALVNIILISFDYTYIFLRDYYYHYTPKIIQFYDPFKGIEPHRFNENYLKIANEYFTSFNKFPDGDPKLMEELINLSHNMVNENPFSLAEKTGDLEMIKHHIREYTGNESSKDGFSEFWHIKQSQLSNKKEFYQTNIKPLVEVNFWRSRDKTGRFTDYFIYVDLFFIIIFLLEFIIMWNVSIRKYGPDQRLLYPLYHWYDLLSCIPLQQLRFLRLLRFLSVYIRLQKSEIITVEENAISREIDRMRLLLSEEISDPVSINILTNIQAKTKLGVNRDLVEQLVIPRKERIKKTAIKNIKKMEKSILEQNHKHIVDFVTEVVLESVNAAPQYQQLLKLPYVGDKLKKQVNPDNMNNLLDQTMKNMTNSLEKALNSETGNTLLSNLIETIIEEILKSLREQDVQELTEEINLDLLEEFKKGSYAKRWKTVKGNTEKLNSLEKDEY